MIRRCASHIVCILEVCFIYVCSLFVFPQIYVFIFCFFKLVFLVFLFFVCVPPDVLMCLIAVSPHRAGLAGNLLCLPASSGRPHMPH
jgi:hypothetical protein